MQSGRRTSPLPEPTQAWSKRGRGKRDRLRTTSDTFKGPSALGPRTAGSRSSFPCPGRLPQVYRAVDGGRCSPAEARDGPPTHRLHSKNCSQSKQVRAVDITPRSNRYGVPPRAPATAPRCTPVGGNFKIEFANPRARRVFLLLELASRTPVQAAPSPRDRQASWLDSLHLPRRTATKDSFPERCARGASEAPTSGWSLLPGPRSQGAGPPRSPR